MSRINSISTGALLGALLLPALAAAQDGKTAAREPIRALPGRVITSVTGDLAYYPIAPCRIFDSRAGSGLPGAGTGPLAAGTAVAIQVTDAGTHLTCGIPYPDAKAVMLNFIAVAPAGAGDLRAWAWDNTSTTPPSASVLNYSVNNGLNIANGVISPICDVNTSTGGSCVLDEFIRPDVHATQVVIDALGYFAAPQPKAPACVVADQSAAVAAGAVQTLFANCPGGYQATGGGFLTDTPGAVVDTGSYLPWVGTYPAAANDWNCVVKNESGASVNVTCRAICCQTTG